ncbi:MAG: hypothetical protein IBJ09_05920 [Bacteroidia bacterium]|nr:hypothetical protein [Bacteroidia bacterium]
MKVNLKTFIVIAAGAVLVAACDPVDTREMQAENASGQNLTLVLTKEIPAADSASVDAFFATPGCGVNNQAQTAGGMVFCRTGCPFPNGQKFTLSLRTDYGGLKPDKKPNAYDLRFWEKCDSFYIDNKTLLRDPKQLSNWMYKTQKRYTTATFRIGPQDLQ